MLIPGHDYVFSGASLLRTPLCCERLSVANASLLRMPLCCERLSVANASLLRTNASLLRTPLGLLNVSCPIEVSLFQRYRYVVVGTLESVLIVKVSLFQSVLEVPHSFNLLPQSVCTFLIQSVQSVESYSVYGCVAN